MATKREQTAETTPLHLSVGALPLEFWCRRVVSAMFSFVLFAIDHEWSFSKKKEEIAQTIKYWGHRRRN
jgi:hypothetical protein